MKDFKKRTIALVLASVVSVVGAFGANNYKNSLMSLKLDSTGNGDVNITVLTRTNYDAEIRPMRKDANTYIIVLQDTNSEMQESPVISGNVESVDVVTMPYTTNNNGYTKITVKTLSSGMLTAKKSVFLPAQKNTSAQTTPENSGQPTNNIPVYDNASMPEPSVSYNKNDENNIENSMKQFQTNDTNTQTVQYKNTSNSVQNTEQASGNNNAKKSNIDPMERNLLILGILAVLLTSVFLFMRGKNKLKEVIGEDFEYNLKDDSKPKKQNNKQDIRNTIQNLDKKYNTPKTSVIKATAPANSTLTANQNSNNHGAEENDTVREDIIVDLDQLYIDSKGQNETAEENQDIDLLADFLNDYESQEKEKELELELIKQREQETNELYEKFMNGEDILFSKDDIQKINSLLMAEISDDTIEKIKRKEATNPIRPPHATQEEILENFITTLTIKQNISFSRDDVEALNKLISVEIDNDFVTDLRTNPERVKSMQKEIEDRKIPPHKVSELLTLSIEDKLPDLTVEIKKQENFNIEDDTNSVIEDNNNYVSEVINNSLNEYDADSVINVDSMPDLKDVIAHPEKYEEPEQEKVIADEETLLKNIENVSFKPFYEETIQPETIDEPEKTNIVEPTEENIELDQVIEEKIEEEKEEKEKEKEEEKHFTETPNIQNKEDVKEIKQEEVQQTYTYNNKEYTVIKTSVLKEGIECHLVKSSDGYSVLGFIGENIFNLREYDNLSPETLQARLSEKLAEGGERYMVRCGKHKFVLDIKENKMEFVMDLC